MNTHPTPQQDPGPLIEALNNLDQLPRPDQLLIDPQHRPERLGAHPTACAATLGLLGDDLPLQDQVRTGYARLLERARRACARAPGPDGAGLPLERYHLLKTLLRVATCRPAGGYVHGVRGLPRGCVYRLTARVCDTHKLCPWCHYRRIAHAWPGLPALYHQIHPYAGRPATLIHGRGLGGTEAMDQARRSIWRQMHQTLKPEACWCLTRPSLPDILRTGGPAFEVRLLCVGTTSKSRIRLPKGVTQRSRRQWCTHGQLAAELYPFQAPLLDPQVPLEALEIYHGGCGRFNDNPDRPFAGRREMWAMAPGRADQAPNEPGEAAA